jgi:hypothetical protein
MIIIQDLNKDIVGIFTTLKFFLRTFHGNGASMGSYDHIRSKLVKSIEMPIKYKSFFITRGISNSILVNLPKLEEINDNEVYEEDYDDGEIIFKL